MADSSNFTPVAILPLRNLVGVTPRVGWRIVRDSHPLASCRIPHQTSCLVTGSSCGHGSPAIGGVSLSIIELLRFNRRLGYAATRIPRLAETRPTNKPSIIQTNEDSFVLRCSTPTGAARAYKKQSQKKNRVCNVLFHEYFRYRNSVSWRRARCLGIPCSLTYILYHLL